MASELFAERGYGGTSTREISQRVGIRQPSLFHHFPSKAAILQALLSLNLDEALRQARRIARQKGPAAPRLYAYLVWDLADVISSPYNLSGIYDTEILNDPDFEPWAKKLEALYAAQRGIISQGVRSGEFVDVDPRLAQEMIAGMTLGLIRGTTRSSAKDAAVLAAEAAAFALRGLLRDPASLPEVSADAA